jgi:predicted permease
VKSEVDEELTLHLELRTEELRARGLSTEVAEREALRQFGDLERTRRYCRRQDEAKEKQMQRHLNLQDLQQDIRIALRNLLRVPMLALTVVATVGLGLGATAAIFGAVDAVILRPLPYTDPGRLVRIYTDAPPNRFPFSVADYLALNVHQTRFEQIAGYTNRPMAFTDGIVAERVRGRVVSWTYFALLGIKPVVGRSFTESDGRPGSPPAVIVSDGFWRRRLGGRPDIIGQSIRLDGSDYAVVGILPGAVGPLETGQEFFVAAQWDTPPRKGPFFITVLGRLRSGSDRSAAADELRAINRRIFPLWQSSYQDEKASWAMMELKDHVIGDVGTAAALALAAVALVWLIASTNATGLLIARVASRRRELAVRAALGASRGRVVGHVLFETSLLAIGAAVVGGALAWVGVRLLHDFGAAYLPRTQEIALDGSVLWPLVAMTAASGLVFGFVPAVHGTSRTLGDAGLLRAMGRSSSGSVTVRRLRRALVASQFAVATPLLIVAGLLIVSLNELRHVNLGFDSRNVVSGSIQLPPRLYQEPRRVAAFWNELQRRVEALPGVSGVAFADGRPPNDVANQNNFDLEALPTPPGQTQPVTPWLSVTPEYFRLLGLTLVQGRLFDDRDGLGNPPVIVVDRAWAKRFFPDGAAVGRRLRQGGCLACPWTTVIGVVSDVKYAGLDGPDQGSVYAPMPARGSQPNEQTVRHFRFLLMRTTVDPAIVLSSIRQIIHELDPGLPFSSVATTDELIAESLQMPRSLSLIVGSLAMVALVLSIVGIYGVMAYYVQQHEREIGIRVALGGSPADVMRLIVGQGIKVAASGVLVGLLTALLLTRLMSSLLFGVSAGDALTFIGVTILLLGVALAACSVPAARAVAVQPAGVLRNE